MAQERRGGSLIQEIQWGLRNGDPVAIGIVVLVALVTVVAVWRAYVHGLDEGLARGKVQGDDDGRKRGATEGYKRGLAEGLEQGRKRGFDEGWQEGTSDTLRRLQARATAANARSDQHSQRSGFMDVNPSVSSELPPTASAPRRSSATAVLDAWRRVWAGQPTALEVREALENCPAALAVRYDDGTSLLTVVLDDRGDALALPASEHFDLMSNHYDLKDGFAEGEIRDVVQPARVTSGGVVLERGLLRVDRRDR